MKRLIICCDGTWQTLTNLAPTNVFKIAQIIKPIAHDGTPQLSYYQPGLGTEHGEFDRITDGILGWGIDTEIQEAYRFLCFNYEPGDEIYLFGFSRGAYTVRSLAGFLYCAGLLQRPHIRKVPQAYELYRDRALSPSHPAAIAFRSQHGEAVPIKLLACWDTVGKLGVPNQIPWLSEWANAKYQFHDTKLNRQIEHALHAVAIDERRKVFEVTPMTISEGVTTTLNQVWFPGTHSCVGGGLPDSSGLSDATLLWTIDMIGKLRLGLEFVDHPEKVADGGIKPDYTISFDPQTEDLLALGGISDRILCSSKNDSQAFFDHNIHLSAKQRWALTQAPLYRPKNLEPYQQWLDAFVAPLTHKGRAAIAVENGLTK
ncbi:DUF2235 domain-containing protein [Microcoleus sp. FACHB-1515]|uniref:DUF2235 domain-containing protein n=1 Tax=Cyanophyceae TaxID=3028117 RepID=UPI001687BAE6|nr:DUF2235 domain-containing protein [Microcoleus sp. FACHB-1515]MBD2092470.1 DUF2235 domain-containing protein [Microcoleus sp. FACHB-1515]